jgi:hypothetical protein
MAKVVILSVGQVKMKGRTTQIAPDLAKAAAKMMVRSK